MRPPHRYYLSLGSNVEPETNLASAIQRLREHGVVRDISGIWESAPVGAAGPNFLNLCISYEVGLTESQLKARVLRPIEAALGRMRSEDKNAPRTMDIDIVMRDGQLSSATRWANAYVILPMAELLPGFLHPLTRKRLSQMAIQAAQTTWIVRREPMLTPQGRANQV